MVEETNGSSTLIEKESENEGHLILAAGVLGEKELIRLSPSW